MPGFRIHWFVVPIRSTVAAIAVVGAAFLRTMNVVLLTPSTASLKVAVMSFPTGTPVAFTAGVLAVTVGGAFTTTAAAVVNDQVVVASGAFARSRIAAAPPVRVTVYVVLAARSAVGFRTHWFVVPFCVAVAAITVPVSLVHGHAVWAGFVRYDDGSQQAERVADQIDAGMVYVNLVGADSAELPFGGTKRSGFGRELGTYGADEFVNKKLIRIG